MSEQRSTRVEDTPDPLRPDAQVAARALAEVRRLVLRGLGETRAKVLLFGSWARGEASRHSDIDVGILPLEALPPGLLGRIREALEESTVPYRVDVVDLSGANPELRSRALAEGSPWTA